MSMVFPQRPRAPGLPRPGVWRAALRVRLPAAAQERLSPLVGWFMCLECDRAYYVDVDGCDVAPCPVCQQVGNPTEEPSAT